MELVRCENLGKRYGRLQALSGINLTIEQGKPVALVGPNGAGKTTLMSLIGGFIRPSAGTVTVCGKTPQDLSVKRRLSVLPQDARLDPNFSIGSQLTLYAKLRGVDKPDTEVEKALELVQLQDRIKSKPTELSHGMSKRLLIAQCLLGQPEIILLDEPTAGIDPPNAKLIRDLIAAESGSSTFVVSSHNLDELEKICEKVIHLSDGKLISEASITEDTGDWGFLTLQADSSADQSTRQIIESVKGLVNLNTNQHSEFTIEFDAVRHPQFHIALLQKLADNNIQYKKLTNGRTLEQRMYSQN